MLKNGGNRTRTKEKENKAEVNVGAKETIQESKDGDRRSTAGVGEERLV